MSHLTSDGEHLHPTEDQVRNLWWACGVRLTSPHQPTNSIVPPDPDQAALDASSKRAYSDLSEIVTPHLFAPPAMKQRLSEQTRGVMETVTSKLPASFEQYPDADPARDKALNDSIRAGVVDDIPIDEQRKLYEVNAKREL